TTWRMTMPVTRGGALVGAMQVDFSLLEVYRLERWLRWTGVALLASSIVLISLLLAFFLERRVARPVAALVEGMHRAEDGALGTPLTSVLGYTQLLRQGRLPAEQARKLAVVESQVQRMIETIRSVLDRTRDREIQRAPVAVAPLVSEAIGLVSTRLAGREVVVQSQIPPDLPPVPGDAAALRQVVINLLANAIDATEPPGTITVGAVVLAANGRGRQ